jgi:hypothetical protein
VEEGKLIPCQHVQEHVAAPPKSIPFYLLNEMRLVTMSTEHTQSNSK